MTRAVIAGDYHLWEGQGGVVMVSHEPTKLLASYASWDDAVTALYMGGEKAEARAVNAYAKQVKA